MEKLQKSTLCRVITILSLSLSTAVAAEKYRVLERQGISFYTDGMGKTSTLHKDAFLEDGDTVQVDEDGAVKLGGPYGEFFHLAGGSSVKFKGDHLELKAGNLWVQSKRPDITYTVETPNALATFGVGDFVVNFVSSETKTQAVVLNGSLKLSNTAEPLRYVTIKPGFFSFVKADDENQLPRESVPFGQNTFRSVKLIFPDAQLIENAIASVDSEASPAAELNLEEDYRQAVAKQKVVEPVVSHEKKDKPVFLTMEQKKQWKKTASRFPSSVSSIPDVKFHYYGTKPHHKNQVIKKAAVAEKKAPVYRYGSQPKTSQRLPASVAPKKAPAGAFKQSLKEEYHKQPKHTEPGFNELINDLKSIKTDHTQDY